MDTRRNRGNPLVSARIYIEGGGDSKYLRIQCREGFRKLFERCGFSSRMPRMVACGSRGNAFGDFQTACRNAGAEQYIAMLIDSEDPMSDIDQPWAHLDVRDGWSKPSGADDAHVLMMVTCMETWIVADRKTLRNHYGSTLQDSALPALHDLELKNRSSIHDALLRATRNCTNAYNKGKRSFEVVGKLDPDALQQHLPSFARCKRLLDAKL